MNRFGPTNLHFIFTGDPTDRRAGSRFVFDFYANDATRLPSYGSLYYSPDGQTFYPVHFGHVGPFSDMLMRRDVETDIRIPLLGLSGYWQLTNGVEIMFNEGPYRIHRPLTSDVIVTD